MLLIPLFPRLPWLLPVLVAGVLAGGNGGLTWLLSRPPDPARLRIVRQLATALEWLAVLSVIGLLARMTESYAPALLPVLVVLGGARYGPYGVVGATAGAWGVIATLTGWRMFSAPVDGAAVHVGVRWAIIVGVMSSIVSAVLWTVATWRRKQLPRGRSELSSREMEVLVLLGRESPHAMNYEQIGGALHLSPQTVKTHVRHISEKLGATGRRDVVRAARRLGLLPPDEP